MEKIEELKTDQCKIDFNSLPYEERVKIIQAAELRSKELKKYIDTLKTNNDTDLINIMHKVKAELIAAGGSRYFTESNLHN